ncbi:MAG: hypothetical protein LBO69_07195 [Ignavibacteria bacterium]|jgi:uncharacterized integral membrane protein|nr:hypothetical protein [Ignavibacteria bacterium]
MKDKTRAIKIIVSIILALVASIFLVALCMQAVAVFEVEMLPGLWLPIIIVWFFAYMFIYGALFKRRRKKTED